MHRYETVATKETGESLWLLQVPVFLPVEEKRWSRESAGIVQSCIRYTNLTIQLYFHTLMSRLSSRENNENVNTYLELLKIGDAHFSGKTCYTFLTRLRESENRPFSLLPELFLSPQWRIFEIGLDPVTTIVTKKADSVTIVTNNKRNSLTIIPH